MEIFLKVCRLVKRLEGRFMTVHLGLGRDSTDTLSWNRTIRALSELVAYAASMGIRVCLENLASGWTSRPELFEKLIRKSNVSVTVDIGHARVSPSVQSGLYSFEDFILPHHNRVHNAHVYHEEWSDGHVPPSHVNDVRDRLSLLCCLPCCDWWVLELREEKALFETLKVVREFLESMPVDRSLEWYGMN